MRIGLVIYGHPDTLTGGYLYDQTIARGLADLGHDVEVISLPSGSYLRRLVLGLQPRLCRQLLDGGFDILIEDELCHPSLGLVNRTLQRRGGPVLVALVHHVLCCEPRQRLLNMLLGTVERRYLNSVHGYICNSKTTQRTLAALVSHDRPQVIAYPAGDRFGQPLAMDIISRRCAHPGRLELLFLGNVIPRKGLLPLLEALAAIDIDLWHLSVVGGLDFDPAHTARARRRTEELGLSASVEFLGPLREEQLIEVLRVSHLFCMPYAYEGFGIAILEAMAFGLPAIGCRKGAAKETISHGHNGFLLDACDLAGLGPLVTLLHRDRSRLRQLAIAAQETYVGRPGWQEAVRAIDGFLQRIVGQHRCACAAPACQNQDAAQTTSEGGAG